MVINFFFFFNYNFTQLFYREEDDNIIPDVITAILNFPDNTCLAVKQTGALLLGELCEWIVRHPQSLGIHERKKKKSFLTFFFFFIVIKYHFLFHRVNIEFFIEMLKSKRITSCSVRGFVQYLCHLF